MRVSYLYTYHLLQQSLVFDSHIEHHLEMTKTTKSNSAKEDSKMPTEKYFDGLGGQLLIAMLHSQNMTLNIFFSFFSNHKRFLGL